MTYDEKILSYPRNGVIIGHAFRAICCYNNKNFSSTFEIVNLELEDLFGVIFGTLARQQVKGPGFESRKI